MPKGMRGISPVIATVIILAVTLAIAIAVVGWVMGLFRSSTKMANVELLGDNYLYASCTVNNATSDVLIVHVRNTGTTTAHIYRLEIVGVGANSTLYYSTSPPPSNVTNIFSSWSSTSTGVALAPGKDTYIAVSIPDSGGKVVPGTSYTIQVYVKESGTPIATTITAEECPS